MVFWIKCMKKKPTSIDSIHFEKVIEGMFQVVERGTARVAKIRGVEMCGKTGTVENFMKIDGVKNPNDRSFYLHCFCAKR